MNSRSSDSSFSFQNKRKQQLELILPARKKPRKDTVKEAVLRIKIHGVPLISRSTGQICENLHLEPCKPYTIGRKLELCDFIFADRRVSKKHCQLYFDSFNQKIYLSDGFLIGYSGCNYSFSNYRNRVSTNGVFVNGDKISGVVELRVGDVVRLVCPKEETCDLRSGIGFLVEKAVFLEEVEHGSLVQFNSQSVYKEQSSCTLKCDRVIDNTNVFLSCCRDILCSGDPVSYIRKCISLDWKKNIDLSFENECNNSSGLSLDNGFEFISNSCLQIGCHNWKRVYSSEVEAIENCDSKSRKEIIVVPERSTKFACSDNSPSANADIPTRTSGGGGVNIQHNDIPTDTSTGLYVEKRDCSQYRELLNVKNCGGCISPPGNKFYLNRLQSRGQDKEGNDDVSLPELFNPIESLKRVFIATFTCDIPWFLTCCNIPPHLRVTIACHNAERCWSVDSDKRTSVPFFDFPNLTVLHPPFPEVIAFNNDRKNSGIACHHPKLIVLQRGDKLRVVITSANLVEKQWHSVTNTVWWQDFPLLSVPNGLSLFTQLTIGEVNRDSRCDFAAQLAGFMASLIVDVPSQAFWILELIKYDFKEAAGYLVASVPGIHSHRSPCVYKTNNYLVGRGYKLQSSRVNFLSSVEASVVGLSHIFRVSADSNGEHLKKLATFLGKSHENMDGMVEIVLRRETNISADMNAVSVIIPNPEDFSKGDFVQLGFLPRNTAKWVAQLSDIGLFAFSAFIHPKEVLATALEGSNMKVKLILSVYAGPSFSTISEVKEPEYVSAICSLIASSQRNTGLWRLKEVLGQYKWPDHLESEFFYGSSSVGSVNAQFLAAFSATTGKRSVPFSDSEESDPDWGCWSASQELKNPSIKIIFPSIGRVKSNINGILASRRLLCFSQKTWQRLGKVGILHDAVPYPSDRIGFPMHVKVGWRRFQSRKDGSSFGWVYCGSHNFSAAAWGRPISDKQSNGNLRNSSVLGSRLPVSNYELGIIFVVPPDTAVDCVKQSLNDIVLPFVVPPPKYRPTDKPATAQAIREAMSELSDQKREINEAILATAADCMEEENIELEEDEILETAQYIVQEKEDEKDYADKLWSQVDSSESC